jgi:hypothetical protein
LTRRTRISAVLLVGALIPLGQSAVALASPSSGPVGIRGAGVSHPTGDDRRSLEVDAKATGSAASGATGQLTFDHHSPVGLNHFTGSVSCLRTSTQNGTTTVTFSGHIQQGQTSSGAPLAGKPFAFTVLSTSAGSQSFSLPSFSPGPPCAGSDKRQVPVTQGSFHIDTAR